MDCTGATHNLMAYSCLSAITLVSSGLKLILTYSALCIRIWTFDDVSITPWNVCDRWTTLISLGLYMVCHKKPCCKHVLMFLFLISSFIIHSIPLLCHKFKKIFQRYWTKTVGFEVLTALVMKSTIFWDIRPCSPLSVNRRIGGTYRLYLQGRKISWARNQRESRCLLPTHWFLAQLFLRTWRWRRYIPPKRRLTFNGLYGVISQKIVIFNLLMVSLNL
jgi:hypothetical protein